MLCRCRLVLSNQIKRTCCLSSCPIRSGLLCSMLLAVKPNIGVWEIALSQLKLENDDLSIQYPQIFIFSVRGSGQLFAVA